MCITPKNQPTASAIDRSVSCDEKRKREVVNASEGTIREAKRQRALMEKKTAAIDLKKQWRKAAITMKKSYNQELETV